MRRLRVQLEKVSNDYWISQMPPGMKAADYRKVPCPGKVGWYEVEAEPFTSRKFEDAELFIFYSERTKKYYITEATTGRSAASGRTPREARKNFIRGIRNISPEQWTKIVQRLQRAGEISPRYKKV